MRRHHVVRQLSCQCFTQGIRIQLSRQRIRHNLAIVVDLHMGIADTVERADALCDLTQ